MDIFSIAATYTTATFIQDGNNYIAEVFPCDAGGIKCVVQADDPVMAGDCIMTLVLDSISKVPGVMIASNVQTILQDITSNGGSHGSLLILAFENIGGKITTSLVFDSLTTGTGMSVEKRVSACASLTGEGVLSEAFSRPYLEAKVLLEYYHATAETKCITGSVKITPNKPHTITVRSAMVDKLYKGNFESDVLSNSDVDSLLQRIIDTKAEDAVRD